MSMELYCWGANSYGQLCLGYHSEQVIHPTQIDLSDINLNPADVKAIAGGAGHTLILDNAGHLFSCGWNKKGQLGVSGPRIIRRIQSINHLSTEKIINIACGWDSSFALTENGEVYGWGSNQYGQLGISMLNLKYTYVPTKIFIDMKVKCIAAGLRHSAIVTDDGQVFVTGSGNKFQLGLVDSDEKPILSVDTFTVVTGIGNIIDVACGQHFTLALASSGDIFTWGSNKHNPLGVNSYEIESSIKPIKLEINFGSIRKVSAGWTHVNILRNDGAIISWGRDTYGQLGDSKKSLFPQYQPRVVNSISHIQQITVGSEHNVALDEAGKIYSWGWNEHGNCGNGDIQNVFEPYELFRNQNVFGVLIGSGAAHSFAIVRKKIKYVV